MMARRAREPEPTGVHCRLEELLDERGMTLTELSRQVDITFANLSVLKNDRGRAIRFSTLVAICEALDCQIGDLLVLADRPGPRGPATDPDDGP